MKWSLLISYLLVFTAPLCAQEADSSLIFEDETETIDPATFTADGYEEEAEPAHELMRPDELATTRSYRAENLSVKRFDEKSWKEIVGDEDFNEGHSKEKKQKQGGGDWSSMPWASPVLKLISYVVIIGVVVLLLYLVFRNVSLDLKIKKERLQTDDIDKVGNIEDVDIQTLLGRARTDGDFRVAVRLYYLGLLKRLHELNVIAWKKDKTNRDYLLELFSKDFYYDDVRQLTNSYEAVWYGEHIVGADAFRRLLAQFEKVYQKINNPPA